MLFVERVRRAWRLSGEWVSRVDLQDHEEKILLLLSLVISATVGLVIVGFVVLTERLGGLLVAAGPVQRVLTPLAGSLVGGYLLFRYFPLARGSGIPQTRVALLLQRGVIDLKTVVGKFLCASISLGSGVALGREGPSVHIGAGIASIAGRRLGLSEEKVKSLIPVGTAAAVAAAFNTPLAAVLFTLEEVLADMHARVVGSVVIGAATSWIVLRLILGDEPLFHVPGYQLVHPVEFLVYAFLGLLGGLVSTLFVKLLLWQRLQFQKVPSRWKAYSPGVGGLVVGLLSLAVPGVLGVGYNLVSEALNGQLAVQIMLLLLVLKIIATTVCYSSGNAGGVFGPSLFIGAMLGGVVGQTVHLMFPDHTGNAGAYALVGMGAAFAGIIRTPMTSVIMIFEVTRDYTIIVPLMIANLCSYFLAQKLQRVPIYEALAGQDGIRMPSPEHRLEPLPVSRAMRSGGEEATEEFFVHPDDAMDLALQKMGAAGRKEIPVVSRTGGATIGVLRAEDALAAYLTPAPESEKPAPKRSWLPAMALITGAAVLIVAGLVVWQRSRRVDLAREAYESGQALLAQGRPEDAVLEFRNALAQNRNDVKLRAALGLALVQTGHEREAAAYLPEVARQQPGNGPVWAGLAKIALANGDANRAQELLRQSLARDWTDEEAGLRRTTQFEYARLLAAGGRVNESIAFLLTLIEQRGDDAGLGKQAAEMVRELGGAEKTEVAYGLLASRFPADSGVWTQLGSARLANGQDRQALDAYQRAVKADPGNTEAGRGVEQVEDILRWDPTRRGLSVRERARRWDEILRRVMVATEDCLPPEQTEKAAALLRRRTASLREIDQKMETALDLWRASASGCKTGAMLTHVMAKLED